MTSRRSSTGPTLTQGLRRVCPAASCTHAVRAGERFGVDARDILVEVGRRKSVGGQEDLIIEVAARLAAARAARGELRRAMARTGRTAEAPGTGRP